MYFRLKKIANINTGLFKIKNDLDLMFGQTANVFSVQSNYGQ